MSDFLPPDAMSLEAAGETLAARFELHARETRDTDRTFYDTFDGLLHQAGLSTVHESGILSLVEQDSGAERAALATPQPTQPVLAFELSAGALRDALLPIVEIRALLPLVHVHSRTRALDVLDDARKTVVRMTLEEPALVDATTPHTALRPRVRLTAVRGYDRALVRVQETLEHELGFRPADQPLVDEAVRAAGGIPGGTSTKIGVPLLHGQRADAAVAAVLKRLLEVTEANLEGAIANIDAEFLHDLRVSVRRSRAVQREFKAVFPPAELAGFRTELRWLQQVTGESRDLDVYVLEFDSMLALMPVPMRSDLDPVLRTLEDRRRSAHHEMVTALRSERTSNLLADWSMFLEQFPELPTADRPAAARPIGELAGQRIRKVYTRMVAMGDAIDASSPSEAYHELRKKGKELRYLLELFGAELHPAEVVKPMIKALKALQDVLGRHQDREVQVHTLRSLAPDVVALPGGAAALMAMGVLVDRLEADKRTTRDEFAQRLDAFAAKSQRHLVRDTFR